MLVLARSFPSCALLLALLSSEVCGQRARGAPRFPDQVSGGGRVRAHAKISNLAGGFLDTLDQDDAFGMAAASPGDVDGDGNADLAVSARDPTAFDQPGAIYILFLAEDGSVRDHHKIDAYHGLLAGDVSAGELMGTALARLGDFDGDGVPDIASYSPRATGPVFATGAIRLLFLARDGTVKAQVENLDTTFNRGQSLANIGDVDGDGLVDLALGKDDDTVSILFLAADGTVRAQQAIGEGLGGFTGTLEGGFGASVAGLGDLDGDQLPDLAVGETGGGGAVWVLLLNADGTVRTQQELTGIGGGAFLGGFGSSLAAIGDLDADGRPDLAAGVPIDAQVFILFLEPDGTLGSSTSIALPEEAEFDWPGGSLAGVDDLDGDGGIELAAGARGNDEGSRDRGAAYMLSLDLSIEFGQVTAKISDRPESLEGTLDDNDEFGSSVTVLGDLDGNGVADLAAGAPGDQFDDVFDVGAVWILFMRSDGTVERNQKIGATHGGFTGALGDHDRFGISVESLGDLDGDGSTDLAVGALEDDDGGRDRGAVYVLFLRPDGTVRTHQKISATSGGFVGPLRNGDRFGSSLAALGDLDGDGVLDVAVGATGDDDGGTNEGAAWVLFLRSDGTVAASQKISSAQGGFTGALAAGDGLGSALESLGDLDGDGLPELGAGANGGDDGGLDRGSVWVLFLGSDGVVRAQQEISDTEGGFQGLLHDQDRFGSSLAALGDLDLDGVSELVVGAPEDDEGGSGSGAAWLLFLQADGRVRAHEKIPASEQLGYESFSAFGSALAALGDRDGDGVPDLVVGAPDDYDGGESHGALWLLELDGLARFGFEHGDDQARTALANGQALVATRAFGRTLELAGAGANLGPATFDSTPLGPNDPSQDTDLLVGKGNLLVLQNSLAPTQTVPGIFDRPNDDQDGGVITLRFGAPVTPLSIDLVDIDQGATQSASVRLVDAAGLTRTYAIPAGWTEDLLLNGGPAWRTLDLTTLAPQPGFAAVATASELAGYAPDGVVRIEVQLGSSGALDELRWDPHPGS